MVENLYIGNNPKGATELIKKFNANPDSNSGIVTVPKIIGAGESVTIPSGRVAVLPNVQVDGTLNIEGEVFIPAGSDFSDVDSRIQLWEHQSFPNWIDDKGDGLPFAYPKNAIVKYTDGNTYVSKVDNNTAIPTDTNNWVNFEDFGGSDRIGLIDYGYVAKPYHIVAFGGEFNRADYPKLWAYLQANPTLLKTQAQWTTESTANGGICGYFSDGNGTTTFRVPNLDKAFLRPDSRTVGSFQKDEFKSHSHTIKTVPLLYTTGSSTQPTYPKENGTVNTSGMINSTGDTETRPKNIAVLPLIVAK